MTRAWRDVGVTCRALSKAPGYAIAAIVTLALAIGATSAIFSAVYSVLLKPLPIRNPAELAIGWGTDLSHNLTVVELPYRAIEGIARDTRSFTSVAAMGSTTWPSWLKGRGVAQRVPSAGVTGRFFETLGAMPMLGRTVLPEDDVPNAPRVLVLSHSTWLTRFGGDPSIVGTRVNLDDRLHTVIGVMPPGFDVPRGTEFWMAVAPIIAASSVEALDNVGVLFLVGRLRPGVTLQAASNELEQYASVQLARVNLSRPGPHFALTSFRDHIVGPVRQALWALLGAVIVLLLITCANVSGLLLTRVSLRRAENGIRLALGASPADLARLWIVETLVLCATGGILGLIASHWILKLFIALAPDDIPRLGDVSINTPVVLFTFVAVLATALLCGAGPARQAVATNVIPGLTDAGRSGVSLRTRRLRSALVVVQISLSIVLLIAAALVLESFLNLQRVDLGFHASGVVTMNVTPENPKPSTSAWIEELLTRLTRLSNVDAAGAVYLRPFALGAIGQETWVLREGQPETDAAVQQNPALNYEVASAGYFTAMGISLKRGRLFESRDDRRSARVAILSESAARRLWPGQDPIGRRLKLPSVDAAGRAEWRTIIGVVGDVRYRGIDDVRLDVYDAALQAPLDAQTLVIRTSRDAVAVAAAAQAEARRLDPNVVIDGLTTMDAAVARILAPWRFSAWTFAMFAAFAFTLALVGLFGVVALDVGNRQHELAVRLAVGARRGDLLRCVLVPATRQILIGAFMGIVVAVGVSRVLRSLLFGVRPIDPSTYAGVVLLVICVVTIGAYLPARRAADVDPAKLFTRS